MFHFKMERDLNLKPQVFNNNKKQKLECLIFKIRTKNRSEILIRKLQQNTSFRKRQKLEKKSRLNKLAIAQY